MPRNNSDYRSEPSEQSEEGENVIREAGAAIKMILRLEIDPKLKQRIIDPLLWAITQAHGKYRLKYRSVGVIDDDLQNPKELIHEHVHTRSSLKERLILSGKEESVDDVLRDVFACTVTSDEDRLLPRSGKGWERYKKAGIRVYDCTVVPFAEKQL